MPQHDLVEEIAKFIKDDVDKSVEEGLILRTILWCKPAHYLGTLCMFSEHFLQGATIEEKMTFRALYMQWEEARRRQQGN